jgi:hypothetical protein
MLNVGRFLTHTHELHRYASLVTKFFVFIEPLLRFGVPLDVVESTTVESKPRVVPILAVTEPVAFVSTQAILDKVKRVFVSVSQQHRLLECFKLGCLT